MGKNCALFLMLPTRKTYAMAAKNRVHRCRQPNEIANNKHQKLYRTLIMAEGEFPQISAVFENQLSDYM